MANADETIDWDGKKKVNLALQGGGSHGAFTWGVLDALLEDCKTRYRSDHRDKRWGHEPSHGL